MTVKLREIPRLIPNKAAQRCAARAREQWLSLSPTQRGFGPAQARRLNIISGIDQAAKISRGVSMNVEAPYKFFARFRNRYHADVLAGKSWRTSKTILKWNAWGGNAFARQVLKHVRSHGYTPAFRI